MDMMKRSGYQDLACERLGAKLTDPKWWVRANAARALARSGRAGVDTLMRMTNSSDAFARDAAFAALAMAPLTSEARLTVRDMIAKSQQQAPKATPQPGIQTQGSAFV
jgi:HEAT repeat protein